MPIDRTSLLSGFSNRFTQLSRVWRQEADADLAPLGLSYATARTLLAVQSLGSAPRQTTLAAELAIEGPSLVRLLDQLCAIGMLTRRDDPTDRRAKTINLTPEGTALVAKAEAALESLRARLTSNIDEDELETALRVLNSIAATIERRRATA